MKVLGISCSARNGKESNTYRLVEHTAKSTGLDYEMISLQGKKISGCIACLGCVKDNVCIIKDDLAEMRDKIVNADAYIIGAPNYYSAMNGLGQCLLERWYQFRHQGNDTLWGKLAVAVGVGGGDGTAPANQIELFMNYNFIETVAKVSGQGTAACFVCGYGETCPVGIPRMVFGADVKITDEMIPDIEKQPELLKNAEQAGKTLAEKLKNNDRQATAGKMQQKMMELFKEA